MILSRVIDTNYRLFKLRSNSGPERSPDVVNYERWNIFHLWSSLGYVAFDQFSFKARYAQN